MLLKYSTSGELLFTKQMGTAHADVGTGVATSGSAVYVVGYTYGKLQTSFGDSDMLVLKLSSVGDVLFMRQMGTPGTDVGRSVAVDSLGGVLVTGYSCGSLEGQRSSGGSDMVLVRLSADGTVEWTEQMGTSKSDLGWGISVGSPEDLIYVVGTTSGQLRASESASGSGDNSMMGMRSQESSAATMMNSSGYDLFVVQFKPTPLPSLPCLNIELRDDDLLSGRSVLIETPAGNSTLVRVSERHEVLSVCPTQDGDYFITVNVNTSSSESDVSNAVSTEAHRHIDSQTHRHTDSLFSFIFMYFSISFFHFLNPLLFLFCFFTLSTTIT